MKSVAVLPSLSPSFLLFAQLFVLYRESIQSKEEQIHSASRNVISRQVDRREHHPCRSTLNFFFLLLVPLSLCLPLSLSVSVSSFDSAEKKRS
jgi:hypothetical protein